MENDYQANILRNMQAELTDAIDAFESNAKFSKLDNLAMKCIDIPYAQGSATLDVGFDGPGFIHYLQVQVGLERGILPPSLDKLVADYPLTDTPYIGSVAVYGESIPETCMLMMVNNLVIGMANPHDYASPDMWVNASTVRIAVHKHDSRPDILGFIQPFSKYLGV